MLTFYMISAWIIGIITGLILMKLFGRQPKYVGNIVVSKYDERMVFSLELEENPEGIVLEPEVKFKVLIPDVEPDRE